LPKNQEIELQTVTPLLLHGVSPQAPPELRAPSLRGVLRYWFRAAAGLVIGDKNLEGLRQMEKTVFGQSEDCASPISIRIVPGQYQTETVLILPHKNQGRTQSIASGGSFTLKFSAYRELQPGAWECAQAALLLMTSFGGLGQRSRRGYGTLRIVKSNPPEIPVTPGTLDEWLAHLSYVTQFSIRQVSILAKELGIPISTSRLKTVPANFPIATALSLIWIGEKKYPDPDTALKALMQGIHNALMLPEYSSSDFLGYAPVNRGNERQASPLWVRVLQTQSNPDQFQLLFTILASNFKHGGQDFPKLYTFIKQFPGEKIDLPGCNI